MILEPQIRGEENFESTLFGRVEQVAVLQRIPTFLERGGNLVRGKQLSQRDRRALIEENSHSGGGQGASSRVLQDCSDLFERDPGKPFHEF